MSNEPSEACCTTPAVVTGDYTAKGTYQPYGGIEKAYVTGPTGTGKALVVIYDIFGYFPQTLQGADILAESINAWVIMPDFAHGDLIDIAIHPPKTDEEKATIGNWFKTTGRFDLRVPEVDSVCKALKNDGYGQVGVVGYCWGGKVAIVSGIESDSVDAVAVVHPAMISAADAEGLNVPLGLYISQGEDKEECDKFHQGLADKPFASKNDYKAYPTMVHGWAAARGDFSKEDTLEAYKDVYSRIATFFNNALA